jgi:hypothetical protein
MRPWLRLVLTALAATLVWLVAERPAHAAAWQCDARGASLVAKAPRLQLPQQSLDAPRETDCLRYLEGDARYERGRAPGPSAEPMPDLAPVPWAGLVPAAAFVDAPRHRLALPAPPEGVRASVDRPPRA